MTAVAVHADFRQAVEFLQDKSQEWGDALLQAMVMGNKDFEAYIRSEQWGGRPGLNRITDNLYTSLSSAAERLGAGIKAMIRNEGANYWWYHDAVSPAGKVPKRTTIPWSFENYGPDMYSARIQDAFQEVFG